MTDSDDEAGPGPDADFEGAIREFLERADGAYAEYENGYADADATLRRLEVHVDDLRDAVE